MKIISSVLTLNVSNPQDMESNCEYVKYGVVDRRQGVVFQFGGWARS
jgi:hypothetical protein